MPDPQFHPVRFIDEEITVEFARPPLFEKKPGVPSSFNWEGRAYQIAELLSSWVDYGRKGRMLKNMRPQNLRKAEIRGSWGVGRFCFRVLTTQDQVFDLYYDRSPRDIDHRKGSWVLYREMKMLFS